MRQRFLRLTLGVALIALGAAAVQADDYGIDPIHSSVYFKISHAGVAYVYGRFNKFTGDCAVDPTDPGKCAFNMNIATESVDTNNAGRDTHLRSPDFFNAKQFPAITFKSTAVKKVGADGYEVTGDMTLHGVTKPVTFTLTGGKIVALQGKTRTGFSTEFTIKRSDFGMKGGGGFLGDEVMVAVSFECVKK